jgi:hypothetical protein
VKEFAERKSRPLYVVKGSGASSAVFEFTSTSVHRTFEGWRKALGVNDQESIPSTTALLEAERNDYLLTRPRSLKLCVPVVAKSGTTASDSAAPANLTTEDYIQVMLSTIRESRQHVNWPPDVVSKFLAADVIR